MNYPGHELDRMSAQAWSAVAADVVDASGQLRRTGIAFVRDHPFSSVAGVAVLGVLLSRAALGPRSAPPQPEAQRSSRRRAHEKRSKKKRSSAMSALGGLVQTWVLEAVASMLKPDPAGAVEDQNDTLTRN